MSSSDSLTKTERTTHNELDVSTEGKGGPRDPSGVCSLRGSEHEHALPHHLRHNCEHTNND